MTTYTVIGDPHAKPNNLDKINTLFDIAEDLGNPVILLGDLLDTKEVIRGKCLNTYRNRIGASKLKFLVLVGNHDWFNLECKEHSLETLKDLPNVQIVDEPIYNDEIALIPYIHDQEKLKSAIDLCEGLTIFCHVDIQEFDFGNGHISDAGLKVEDFAKAKRVISGHYHKRQERLNVVYLGTPFSHSFGETNQDKFIGIYDTETDELQFLETPFPRHLTEEIDCSKVTTHEPNDIDFQRAILCGTQEEIDRFTRHDHVKYIENPTSLVKASSIEEGESPELQFAKWAKDIKNYSDDILELGLEVLGSV